MFSIFSKPTSASGIPDLIYGAVVAKARDRAFFTDYGVPDTVMGRFDMLALHVYLFSRRMKKEGSETALSLSQAVFDLFVADIERALRELGIGDTAVPKRKKKMVRSFYGQIEDFDVNLDAGNKDEMLIKVENRYYETASTKNLAVTLNNYIVETDKALGEIRFNELVRGELVWPELECGVSQ